MFVSTSTLYTQVNVRLQVVAQATARRVHALACQTWTSTLAATDPAIPWVEPLVCVKESVVRIKLHQRKLVIFAVCIQMGVMCTLGFPYCHA